METKNNKYRIICLVMAIMFYFYAAVMNFFGYWLILISAVLFGIGTLFLIFTPFTIKQKFLLFLGAIVLYAIPLIYGSFVW